MKAGYVVHDADGNVVGADDPANHHAWRVGTDWATADLTKDAANFMLLQRVMLLRSNSNCKRSV